MKRVTFFVFFIFSLTEIAQSHATQRINFSGVDGHINSTITFQIIPAPKNIWGYDIYTDERLTIYPPVVSSIPCNEGFKTKAAAQKIAELVINNMKKGEMPPSITIKEMKKLKVL